VLDVTTRTISRWRSTYIFRDLENECSTSLVRPGVSTAFRPCAPHQQGDVYLSEDAFHQRRGPVARIGSDLDNGASVESA
jgi:hypothetical protein